MHRTFAALSAMLAISTVPAVRANLIITVEASPGTSLAFQQGFAAAAGRWESLITDNVTVHLQIAAANLGATTLAGTTNYPVQASYGNFLSQLQAHATSQTDATAVAHLPLSSNPLPIYINRTASGANPYFETDPASANRLNVQLTTANARVLGLLSTAPSYDASVQFNSAINWDFDPSDGIASNAYDFVGAATHEIAHALGFESEVDNLIATPFQPEGAYTPFALDLFRHSAAGGTAVDLTADTRAKYFSLDGSASGTPFSTGQTYGDGYQASHWKHAAGAPYGILDPVIPAGTAVAISNNDLAALDAIGYTLVPEPLTLGTTGIAAMTLLLQRHPPKNRP